LKERIDELKEMVKQIWEVMTDPHYLPLADGCDFKENKNFKYSKQRVLLSHQAACQQLDRNDKDTYIICQELFDIMKDFRDGLTLDNRANREKEYLRQVAEYQKKYHNQNPNFAALYQQPHNQFLQFSQPTKGWHLVPVAFDNGTRHFFVYNYKIKMVRELAQPAVVTGIVKCLHKTYDESKDHLKNNFSCNHNQVFNCILVPRHQAVLPANNNANNMEQVVQAAVERVERAVPAAVQAALEVTVPAAMQTAWLQCLSQSRQPPTTRDDQEDDEKDPYPDSVPV